MDNKFEKSLGLYKKISYVAPMVVIVLSAIAYTLGENLFELIVEGIPLVFSSYFVLKHAIIPDIERGFTKPLKPYYILMIIFFLLDLLAKIFAQTELQYVEPTLSIIQGILILYMIPVSVKGVSKWYI